MWGEPFGSPNSSSAAGISTHSPRVGRTGIVNVKHDPKTDFNSLAPCGANPLRLPIDSASMSHFNSLAPCGANLHLNRYQRPAFSFQLTRPVWGEPNGFDIVYIDGTISTHSPRVGRTINAAPFQGIDDISTHSPRVGRTLPFGTYIITLCISTHSPRVGRTLLLRSDETRLADFNSLAPCGANRNRQKP